MLVIRIDKRTTGTCLSPKRWDCSDLLLHPEDVYLQIRRKACPQPGTTVREFDGCQWTVKKVLAPPPLTIQYNAFEVNDDGQVCFIWDSLLFSQGPGRYTADIFVCATKRATVELQLEDRIRFTNPKQITKGCGYDCARA
jgi:hypothetical protein